MVSGVSIVAMVITLLVSLVLPIALWIVWIVKCREKKVGLAVFLGVLGYYVMQNILYQTIFKMFVMRRLVSMSGYMIWMYDNYALYAFIPAVSVALVEVIARYVMAKILTKKLTYEHGIALGLGHGGIEAITLVGITYINNLLYSAMINTGMYDVMLNNTGAITAYTSSLHKVKETLVETSATTYLLAGYERLLTFVMQVALSLLVCYFVKQKKGFVGALLCFVIHMLVRYIVLIISAFGLGMFEVEISYASAEMLIYLFLTVVAVGAWCIIRKLKKTWR